MILIAAGSSLPCSGVDSQQIVSGAFLALSRMMSVVSVSPFYCSEAWPDPAEPAFVNAVAEVKTMLSPPQLLAVLHATESAFGRSRNRKNEPRTLDLDLLAYNETITEGADRRPILPHPGIEEREFVLVPLSDIAPNWRHPVSRRLVSEMVLRFKPLSIKKIF